MTVFDFFQYISRNSIHIDARNCLHVGGERDVVVFSAAATYLQHLNFISKRMTNVFVTRAKKKLIVIGSSKAIKDSKSFLLKLYEYTQKEGLILNL
jgi:superfamily I DNA and/or RNA helicase